MKFILHRYSMKTQPSRKNLCSTQWRWSIRCSCSCWRVGAGQGASGCLSPGCPPSPQRSNPQHPPRWTQPMAHLGRNLVNRWTGLHHSGSYSARPASPSANAQICTTILGECGDQEVQINRSFSFRCTASAANQALCFHLCLITKWQRFHFVIHISTFLFWGPGLPYECMPKPIIHPQHNTEPRPSSHLIIPRWSSCPCWLKKTNKKTQSGCFALKLFTDICFSFYFIVDKQRLEEGWWVWVGWLRGLMFHMDVQGCLFLIILH